MKTLKNTVPMLHKVRHSGWGAEHRGTATQRGYGFTWSKLRLRVLERDRGICQVGLRAGNPHPGNECDHIVPKANGGNDSMSNLQCICRACHSVKTQQEAGTGARFKVW